MSDICQHPTLLLMTANCGICGMRAIQIIRQGQDRIAALEKDKAETRSKIITIAAGLARDSWDDSADYLGEKMKLAALAMRNVAKEQGE